MSFIIPLILALILFSVGILVAIRYLLFQDVTRATSHLDKLGEGYDKKEEEINKRLQEAREQSEELLSDAGKEALEIRTRSLKDTEEERVKILKEARLQSEQIIQQAHKTRDFLMEEIDQRVLKESIQRACELMREVIPDRLRREVHSHRLGKLADRGLEGLENVSLPDTVREARVLSAYELSGEERALLKSELEKKVGDGIEMTEETDPNLIAGFTIAIGGVVVDASLRHNIQEAAKNVRHSTG